MEKNFWNSHPEVSKINPFKDLYTNDKSKSKGNSSTLMWVVWYLYDKASFIKNYSFEEKRDILESDIIRDKDYFVYNDKNITKYGLAYQTLKESPAERAYRELEAKLVERTTFIKDTPYTIDSAKMLDDMFKNTESIFKALAQAREALNQENEKGKVRGDKELSMSDKGAI